MGPWQPWPQQHPPQLDFIACCNACNNNVVALLGSPEESHGRGRYGMAGYPASTQPILLRGGASFDHLLSVPSANTLRVVVLGYELGAAFNALPRVAAPPRGQPGGIVADLSAGIVVDHELMRYATFGDADLLPGYRQGAQVSLQCHQVVSDQQHASRIQRVLQHIACGDIYQANIAMGFQIKGTVEAASLMARLYRINPVAHGAYIRAEGVEIVSNSMETLLTFDAHTRRAVSYPIKGTMARQRGALDLRASPKDVAEHVMIVDLVRNDLGKVCIPGSVRVDALMTVRGYHGVWHGVSAVSGTLPRQRKIAELVRAVFPGGSITGAPKRRAMQIITQIEGEGRGFYTGSIGLLTPNGGLSMSILIRTLVRDKEGWHMSVGGGIVADSVPSKECDEIREKMAFLQAHPTTQNDSSGELNGL